MSKKRTKCWTFKPKMNTNYTIRTAVENGEKYQEMIVRGQWWRIWPHPTQNKLILSDPRMLDHDVIEAPIDDE